MTEKDMKFDVRSDSRSELLSAMIRKLDSLAPTLTDDDFPVSVTVSNPHLCGWELLNANQDLAKVEIGRAHV